MKRGETVELLPVSTQQSVKSLDATRDGMAWEFKTPKTSNGKNATQSAIKHASVQKAENLLISVRLEHTTQAIIEGIFAGFQLGRARWIQKLEFLFENETSVVLTRKEIDGQEFGIILENHKRQLN